MKRLTVLILATMVLGVLLFSGVVLAQNKTGTDKPNILMGTNDGDNIRGKGGADDIGGKKGPDDLFGNLGNDTLHGGYGNDWIEGNKGLSDVAYGDGGKDDLFANREIQGGFQAAKVKGGRKPEKLLGGRGNDTLTAKNGKKDIIRGGPGRDKAYVDPVDKVTGVEKEVVRGGGGPPQCNDGIDNDSEGAADFPDDPGCTSATDNTESPNPQVANNNAPVANNDELTTKAWVPKDINVITNDTDVDGDNLSVSAFTQPSHGQVTKNPDGTLKYTPDENDPALLCDLPQCPDAHDSFDYTVSDGNGGTDTGTVNVTVERS